MKKATDRNVRTMVIIITMIVVALPIVALLATGGVSIRNIEAYHCDRHAISQTELFACGLVGKDRKYFVVPYAVYYVKKVHPFGFYMQYSCEADRYATVHITSVQLTTDQGLQLQLSNELPFTDTLLTVQMPGQPPVSGFSQLFKTAFDVPFDRVDEIKYHIELALENADGLTQYVQEGTMLRHIINETGKCQ